MSRGANRAVSLLIAAFAVACGGGGGGGGDSGTPLPGSDGSVPSAPPLPPALAYGGSTGMASLADENVGLFADLIHESVVSASLMADSLAAFVFPGAGVFGPTTTPGPEGGTVTSRGRMGDNNLGWVILDYNNYAEGGTTRDGRVVLERLELNARWRIGFHDLRVQNPRLDQSMRGVLTASRRLDLHEVATTQGSLLIHDLQHGYDVLSEDLATERVRVTVGQSNVGFELSATGRIYQSQHGALDFHFESPWTLEWDEVFPVFGGPVIATAASGHNMRIVSLDRNLVSLQYSTGTPPVLRRAARVVWPLLFDAQVRGSRAVPEADPGANLFLPADAVVELDPGYSSHPHSRFLSFRWRVLYRPPDSVADVDDPTAFAPRIALDQPGGYLVEVEVDDGLFTASDIVALTAGVTIPDFGYRPRAQLVRNQTGHVGQTVRIDRSRYAMTSLTGFASNPPPISVRPPTPDFLHTTLEDGAISFVPPVRGIYEVVLGDRPPIDVQRVAIDAAMPFQPLAWFSTAAIPLDIAVGDMNGDGIDDFVLLIPESTSVATVEVVYGAEVGGYSTRTAVEGSGRAIAVGDFNSDGRLDIAAMALNGLHIYLQDEVGSFLHSATLSTCGGIARPGQLFAADFNGDGRTDIVAAGCGGTFQYALQEPDGSLAPLAEFDPGTSSSFDLLVGDLNGDDIADVVIHRRLGLGRDESIAVVYGTHEGVPTPPVFLPYAQSNLSELRFAIGDLRGDGRQALVVATGVRDVRVYEQNEDRELVATDQIVLGYEVLDVKLGDFQRTGRTDIAVRRAGTGGGMAIFAQHPDGSFSDATRVALGHGPVSVFSPLVQGDFNGDGAVDIAAPGSLERQRGIALLFGHPR